MPVGAVPAGPVLRSPAPHYNHIVEGSAPQQPEITVGRLTAYIKQLIESDSELRNIWVKGEASNVRLAGSGHLYFTLKDADSQITCAWFGFGRRKARPPADGDAVMVHGDVRVYPKGGNYQIIVDDIIKGGQGDLAAQFEALKRKLDEEGLFAPERKQRPPAVAGRIGIVTGIATAALQDVLNVLRRRAPYMEVVLFPSSVQGDKAAPEIIRALQEADRFPGLDTILLVRGGGSLEDLWCFNDEKLARAIAAMTTPVISGVGHEIDFTIADFVADFRAPTPSAAAEVVTPDVNELRNAVGERTGRLVREVRNNLGNASERLTRLFDHRLLRDVAGTVQEHSQRLDDIGTELAEFAVEYSGLGSEGRHGELLERMAMLTNRQLEEQAYRLPRLSADFLRLAQHASEDAAQQIGNMDKHLRALDPRAPLGLGFSLVWKEDGSLVRNADSVDPGAILRVQPQQGEMRVRREDPDA